MVWIDPQWVREHILETKRANCTPLGEWVYAGVDPKRRFVDPKLVLRDAPLSLYKATASLASSKPAVATLSSLPTTHHGLRRFWAGGYPVRRYTYLTSCFCKHACLQACRVLSEIKQDVFSLCVLNDLM